MIVVVNCGSVGQPGTHRIIIERCCFQFTVKTPIGDWFHVLFKFFFTSLSRLVDEELLDG